MAIAQVIIALAHKTGWSDKYILEELPLDRFLIYRHVLLCMAGEWTVPPSEEASVESQLAALGL